MNSPVGKRRETIDRFRSHSPAVLPSLLQCDFLDLRREIDAVTAAGCDILHLDVMDGRFVPNLTYGMPIVRAAAAYGDVGVDVHLMIADPIAYIDDMADAGADMLTFHIESVDDPRPVIDAILARDVPVGLALNPDTPLDRIRSHLDDVDLALVMSVNAGFGGQSFNPVAIQKIAEIRQIRPDILIEVDGGIDANTVAKCRDAGGDLFVVGSAIFGRDDYAAAVSDIHAAIRSEDLR